LVLGKAMRRRTVAGHKALLAKLFCSELLLSASLNTTFCSRAGENEARSQRTSLYRRIVAASRVNLFSSASAGISRRKHARHWMSSKQNQRPYGDNVFTASMTQHPLTLFISSLRHKAPWRVCCTLVITHFAVSYMLGSYNLPLYAVTSSSQDSVDDVIVR